LTDTAHIVRYLPKDRLKDRLIYRFGFADFGAGMLW